MSFMLEARGLTLRAGGRTLLDDVSLWAQLPGFGLVRRWKGPAIAGFLRPRSICGAK
jgi:hypothetical protein